MGLPGFRPLRRPVPGRFPGEPAPQYLRRPHPTPPISVHPSASPVAASVPLLPHSCTQRCHSRPPPGSEQTAVSPEALHLLPRPHGCALNERCPSGPLHLLSPQENAPPHVLTVSSEDTHPKWKATSVHLLLCCFSPCTPPPTEIAAGVSFLLCQTGHSPGPPCSPLSRGQHGPGCRAGAEDAGRVLASQYFLGHYRAAFLSTVFCYV